MAHVIQLALGAFISNLHVECPTKSWEAHERNLQFRATESIDIEDSQRLQKEGNSRITKVMAMRADLVKIIEKVHILGYFESSEADLHIAVNACCIHLANTWLPKQVH
jgi:hypothetical protein